MASNLVANQVKILFFIRKNHFENKNKLPSSQIKAASMSAQRLLLHFFHIGFRQGSQKLYLFIIYLRITN